jgi:iron complex transport system substrate-binding protein
MSMRIKKMIFFLVVSISSILFSLALPALDTGITVTDDAGRSVLFQGVPKTIVSLSPANTEILFAIGAGGAVVGVTEYCNFPEAALAIGKVGGFSDISVEKVVRLKPDVVFASNLHAAKIVPALDRLKLKVVVIDPDRIESVFDSIRLAGKILGKNAESEKLVSGMLSRYDALIAKVNKSEKVPLFWEISGDLWTVGKGSFIDDLLAKAGGFNIASSLDSPWLQLSGEYIVKANPRVIFLADFPFGTKSGDLAKRPGWGSVSAVKSGNIIEVSLADNDKVSRAGPRIIDALEYVMRVLHPESFEGKAGN